MLLDPLHPMVVHFPIVFVVILPIVAVVAILLIGRGARPARAWSAVAGLGLALFVSSFVAVRTGEGQEERVEEVVAERPLHSHEEAGERFLLLSGGLALLLLAGMFGGQTGRYARAAGTVGAFALVVAGVQVGHSGGELVYRHGAADAWTRPAAGEYVEAAVPDSDDGDEDGRRGG